jgi:hypothetical protein
MKKIAVIVLVVFYLIPVVGFSINLHWCGNSLTSVKIGTPFSTQYGSCQKGMQRSCCKNKSILIKFNDNQNKPATVLQSKINCVKVFAQSSMQLFTVVASIAIPFYTYHAPPFKSKLPGYLSNNVFRV